MTIKRIVPNISSNDFEKSKYFYGEFLGLDLVMDMGWVMTFSSKTNPQSQITIIENKENHTPNAFITITIEVSDIDELYEKALANRFEIVYPITNESWGVRRFFVKDPNGVTLNLMCHIK